MHMNFSLPPETMPSSHSHAARTVAEQTIYAAMANTLDEQSICPWLERNFPGCRVVAPTRDEPLAVALATSSPDLVIVDPQREKDGASGALAWQRRHASAALLIVDARPCEAVVLEVLRQPGVSYLTRDAGLDALLDAVCAILDRGERVFDPQFAWRVRRTSRRLKLAHLPTGSLSMLTPRELEVMRRLALGATVAQCALTMKLSTSTIDNHRSRLMKKLHLHKVASLVRRAIRDGLIDP